MMRQLVWTHAAAKEFDDLDETVQEAVVTALARFTAYGHGNIMRLKGRHQGSCRLRVGDYRVRFTLPDPHHLLITRVRQRDEAYRD